MTRHSNSERRKNSKLWIAAFSKKAIEAGVGNSWPSLHAASVTVHSRSHLCFRYSPNFSSQRTFPCKCFLVDQPKMVTSRGHFAIRSEPVSILFLACCKDEAGFLKTKKVLKHKLVYDSSRCNFRRSKFGFIFDQPHCSLRLQSSLVSSLMGSQQSFMQATCLCEPWRYPSPICWCLNPTNYLWWTSRLLASVTANVLLWQHKASRIANEHAASNCLQPRKKNPVAFSLVKAEHQHQFLLCLSIQCPFHSFR